MSNISYKHHLIQVVSALIVSLVAIVLFIYVVDPYQQYRASDEYVSDQRMEIPGVARWHDYNTALVGSSMVMNMYPQQVDSLMGGVTMNFSVMGVTSSEYDVLLPYLQDVGKAKFYIVGLDIFSFSLIENRMPAYLYDQSMWSNYAYLLNYTSVKNAIRKLSSPVQGQAELYHFHSPWGRTQLLNAYTDMQGKGYAAINTCYVVDSLIARFDRCFLRHIQNSPRDVQWCIFFPPYSIYEFVAYDDMGRLEDVLEAKRHAVEALSQLENVRLFDFQVEPWLTDMDDFMDLRHHSHKTNRAIIEGLYANQFRAQVDSLETNCARISELVPAYRDSVEFSRIF